MVCRDRVFRRGGVVLCSSCEMKMVGTWKTQSEQAGYYRDYRKNVCAEQKATGESPIPGENYTHEK